MAKNQGSHQDDSLGGRSKQSQKAEAPETLNLPTMADAVRFVEQQKRAEISEVTGHPDKKDLPPTAPGKSTRVSKESDGSISQPNAGTFQTKPEQNVHGGDFSLGAQGRRRPPSCQVEQAVERPVSRLHDTRNRQLGSNGKRGN